jgi:murein DD-endopeptidase MepM/ murein hydrolase activator NlpD
MAVARIRQRLAAGTLLAATLPALAAAQTGPDGTVQRGRQVSEWLLRGQVDSLYPRMGRGLQSSIGGRAGLAKFLERVGALGSEVGDPREVVYRESAGTYYYRIARFQRAPSVTTYMIWDSAGTIQGLLVQPTPAPAPSDFTTRPTRTPLRLPFDGQAYVAWGGREPHQNYHVEFRDQRYASDFFLLEDGKVHRGTGARNEDYACFGRPILAPAAGTVRAAVDTVADNQPGRMNPQAPPGNYAILEHGKGEFSLLAHLRQGSLRVRPGARVEAGDTLGLCGNSGNSSAPHLHYHLQTTGRAGHGVGLPAQFLDYRADGEEVERGEPVRGQTIETPDRDSTLTLARIFDSSEFDAEYLGPVRWIEGQAAYARLEPDSTGARALVRRATPRRSSSRTTPWPPTARGS